MIRVSDPCRRAIAVFLLALLVRLAPLNRYITPDEPIWVLRSIDFADAVAARDWSAIPQTGHPGLTTMALGALGIRLMQGFYPAEAAAHIAWLRNLAWLPPENGAAFTHLVFFLPTCRALVSVTTSLGLALAYLLARRRLGERPARLLAVFLALDPFFAGLAGLLHTDALQATFILLAALLLCPPLALDAGGPFPRFPDLLPAALCLALAGLTKTLGLLPAPGFALAALCLWRGPWQRRWLFVGGLAALSLLFLVGLYPPFWRDPVAALQTFVAAVGYHEGIGLRETFFLGQLRDDPGLFFYPLVLLFRMTPPVLIGTGLALRRPAGHRATLWFVLPGLFYLAVLTLAAKKFDRYALTVIPLLAAPAAVAWASLRHAPHRWKLGSLVALLLPWAIVAPLPLYYADPLLGGPWLARQVIPLGWGEAAGLAAAQANRRIVAPEARTLLVGNVPGAASFFAGTTHAWDDTLIPCADVRIPGVDVGTAGVATSETLRLAGLTLATSQVYTATYPEGDLLLPGPLPGAPAEAVALTGTAPALRQWLEARFPSQTPFTWVHAGICYPLTERQLADVLRAPGATCTVTAAVAGFPADRCAIQTALPDAAPYLARFGESLELLAATWPTMTHAPDTLVVDLRWQVQAASTDRTAHLALWDADGRILWAKGGHALLDHRTWPVAAWEPGAILDSEAYLPLPLDLPPGDYILVLVLYDADGRQQGLLLPGGFGGIRLVLGKVQVTAPPYPAAELALAQSLDVPLTGLYLRAADPPPGEHWAGDPLPFGLGWERTPGDPPEALQWSLVCENGQRDGGTLSIAPTAPATWRPGHRYVTRYAPRTAAALGDGVCEFRVQMGGTITGTEVVSASLGTVLVHARERLFALPQPPQTPLSVTVGAFARLVGVDRPEGTLRPGEDVSLALYWAAQSPAELDYTVFVHWVGPDGQSWAQSDAWPENGNAPTTSWLPGQIVVDTHTATLRAGAPAGDYTVFVGLYDRDGGSRVPLYDANGARLMDDRAPVFSLKIAP
ncbi:MAG: glycosyltransferase family 39 protein [Anaerolineae bacterium]|nr:glycosyltransferase family 39 protein [Anaerolineae bacterium]